MRFLNHIQNLLGTNMVFSFVCHFSTFVLIFIQTQQRSTKWKWKNYHQEEMLWLISSFALDELKQPADEAKFAEYMEIVKGIRKRWTDPASLVEETDIFLKQQMQRQLVDEDGRLKTITVADVISGWWRNEDAYIQKGRAWNNDVNMYPAHQFTLIFYMPTLNDQEILRLQLSAMAHCNRRKITDLPYSKIKFD